MSFRPYRGAFFHKKMWQLFPCHFFVGPKKRRRRQRCCKTFFLEEVFGQNGKHTIKYLPFNSHNTLRIPKDPQVTGVILRTLNTPANHTGSNSHFHWRRVLQILRAPFHWKKSGPIGAIRPCTLSWAHAVPGFLGLLFAQIYFFLAWVFDDVSG